MTAHSPTELLIAVIADLLRGCRHVAVGASSPIPGAGALLARARSCASMRVTVLGSLRNEAERAAEALLEPDPTPAPAPEPVGAAA